MAAVVDDEDIDLLDFFSNDDIGNAGTTAAAAAAAEHDCPPSAAVVTPSPNARRRPSASVVTTTKTPVPKTLAGQPIPLSNRDSAGNVGRLQANANNSKQNSTISNISRAKPPPPLADFTEAFSGLRVRNRVLSAEDMRVRMKGRRVHRLDYLRALPLRALESQDVADAWATLGVLVAKSTRRQSANGGSYSIWTLSDLSRKENDLSVFLFQEALGSHWTVCEGTLLAVVGAKVLPPKAGDTGGKGRLALSVDTPWQIHKIGMAMDYALCKGKRKDGKPCTMPVNKVEGGYCEFHVVAAFNRAQRQGNDLSRSKAKEGSSGQSLRSMLMGNAAAGRMSAAIPTRRFPTTTLPKTSLGDVVGAGARRREDVGSSARFGGSAALSGTTSRRKPSEMKMLRPTAMRAAGRTTILSSVPASVGRSSKRATTHPQAAAGKGNGRAGIANGDCNRNSVSSQTSETKSDQTADLLGLPWAYGDGSGDSDSKKGTAGASAGRKRPRDVSAPGGGGGGVRNEKSGKIGGDGERKKGALDIDPTPNFHEHPDGSKSGSVAIPAESGVFKQNADRFRIRPECGGARAAAPDLDQAHVEYRQRQLKAMAEMKGITLAPADPNAINSRQPLRGRIKSKISGKIGSNSLLSAGTGKGSSAKARDPLASKVKKMTSLEKELLLRTVSKYAGLAEEERANEADKNMQRLEQREAMADKAEEVTKMIVTVWSCAQCNLRRHFFSKRCRELGHEQKGIKATMRFFECTNCRRRTKSTDRVPLTGCEGCGKHNAWKRCGARSGRGPAEGGRDKRFVTAVSEWTDQRDLSLSAPDFR